MSIKESVCNDSREELHRVDICRKRYGGVLFSENNTKIYIRPLSNLRIFCVISSTDGVNLGT